MSVANPALVPVDLEILPFIRPGRLWVTEPTGLWGEDNATGRAYADALLDHIEAHDLTPLFGQVVKAIVASGQWGGIEVGFFHRIADWAVSGG